MVKFLIIGDLHGSKPNMYFDDFDAIIAPGDFCSDELRKYMFEALEKRMNGEDVEWYDLLGKSKAKKMVKESLDDGREVLEHLNSLGVPVFIVPGNWDWTENGTGWDFLNEDHFSSLIEGLDNVVNLHNWVDKFEEVNIIGRGISSGAEYPQSKEDLESYSLSELHDIKENYEMDYEKVASLFEQVDNPIIFLTHNVPYDTPLDIIENEDSPRKGEHSGSVIARDLVDEYQPLICVGAHIHEHFGKCEVGNTTVINAGFGPEVNTLLEIENGKVKKLEFHSD